MSKLFKQNDLRKIPLEVKNLKKVKSAQLEFFGATFGLDAFPNVHDFGDQADGEEYLAIALYAKHSHKSL